MARETVGMFGRRHGHGNSCARAGEETLSLGRLRIISFANGRYQCSRCLGEGGQKRVFLARDTELDRDVVIGVLNRRQIESDSLNRLRREAKAMARLDEHPNVVSVYDIGEEEGNPFIVTQYVRGGSVADVLSACRPAPLQLPEAIRIAAQTCRALNHAHAHGILHRDVKPRNVWLMRDGTVKLGDFGLALSLDRTELTDEDMRAGTAAYIAPEQALGSAVSPQSDLYSLGVMLYEMVAGRRPFSGDTALAVISQHVNSRPVAPSWHNPAINDALDRLILELLAKSPADRPTSAAVVADSLEAMLVGASPAEARPAPVRETTSLDRLASGVFVGRIQEIMQLREGLKGALTGRGRLFLVSGEPGSGKTRLTEELTTYARMRGSCVLVGKCFDGKGAPAFWPWLQAIRRYTHDREPNELHDVMGPGAADIAQLDSEIRQRLPALPTPPTLEPEQARFRLFDSITTFLRNAALSRPVLLILDDLQWADEPSLRLLQFLAQEIRDAHLLIVGTYRDVALGRGHPLARTLAEVGREDLGHQIRLEGLSREEVGRYIELTSGISPPEILVQRIWDKTEGNPFFVSETIRLLITEGVLENPEALADLQINIPPRVRDVVRRRLEQLSDHCNKTLTLAAVYGREFSLEVIEALSDADRASGSWMTSKRRPMPASSPRRREAIWRTCSRMTWFGRPCATRSRPPAASGCMRILPACWNAYIRARRSSIIWLSWRGTFWPPDGPAIPTRRSITRFVRVAGRWSNWPTKRPRGILGLQSRYSKARRCPSTNRGYVSCCRTWAKRKRGPDSSRALETFQRAFEVARRRRGQRPNGPGGYCFRMADLEHQQAGCEQRASVQRSAPRTAGRSTSLASEASGRASQGAQGPGLRGGSRRIGSRGGRTRTAGGGAVDALLCAGVGAPHDAPAPRTSASGFPMPSNASKRRERRATWRR